ncbi:MAG: MarR family winged helix-turn-helix transcriptional regulator [Gammaproteobacteria bacterium]|nr:MarR family winged helix-turn-helix transcriptional regulator [Gammaproteobacteria bacterium]
MSNSAFGFKRPEDSPGLLLWQTTTTWQRLIKSALAEYDISHPQFVILAILLWFTEKGEDPTQIAIIRLSKLDKMTVSQSLKKLCKQDLVVRAEHEQDTRAKSVHLTQQGQTLAAKLVKIIEKIDADFFGQLTQSEGESLVQVLGVLNSK